jgi:hypothetical protein
MTLISGNRRAMLLGGAMVIALAVTLGLTLRGVTAVGGLRTEGHTIPLQGAIAARIELTINSGELRLGQGSSRLLDGAFTYNVKEWDPDISYRVISREGLLRIEQGTPDGPFSVVYGNTVNTWNLLLSPDIPLDLQVDLGKADGTFALGGLQLIDLAIDGKGGDQVVDLTGLADPGLAATISTGGGDLVLTLPAATNAHVIVKSGDVISAEGFTAVDDVYATATGDHVPPLTITVDARGGQVTLLQNPAEPFATTVRDPLAP